MTTKTTTDPCVIKGCTRPPDWLIGEDVQLCDDHYFQIADGAAHPLEREPMNPHFDEDGIKGPTR